jgi:hypothetical protein
MTHTHYYTELKPSLTGRRVFLCMEVLRRTANGYLRLKDGSLATPSPDGDGSYQTPGRVWWPLDEAARGKISRATARDVAIDRAVRVTARLPGPRDLRAIPEDRLERYTLLLETALGLLGEEISSAEEI